MSLTPSLPNHSKKCANYLWPHSVLCTFLICRLIWRRERRRETTLKTAIVMQTESLAQLFVFVAWNFGELCMQIRLLRKFSLIFGLYNIHLIDCNEFAGLSTSFFLQNSLFLGRHHWKFSQCGARFPSSTNFFVFDSSDSNWNKSIWISEGIFRNLCPNITFYTKVSVDCCLNCPKTKFRRWKKTATFSYENRNFCHVFFLFNDNKLNCVL